MWSVVAVISLALAGLNPRFGQCAGVPPRERPLVVLVIPRVPSNLVSEAVIRLNGELVGAGFDVRSTDRGVDENRPEDVDAIAREMGAAAAIALVESVALDSIQLLIADRITAKSVQRKLNAAGRGAADAELLAIRAAELLRASLLQSLVVPLEPPAQPVTQAPTQPVTQAPTPSLPAPQPVITWVREGVEAGRSRRVRARLDVGAALMTLRGGSTAIAPWVSAGLVLDGRWGIRAAVATLGSESEVRSAEGSAGVHQSVTVVQGRYLAGEWLSVRPSITAGAGLLRVVASGQGSWPYHGVSSSAWAFCVTAGVGAGVPLGFGLELTAEAQIVIAHPYQIIQVGQGDTATAGRPTMLFGLLLGATR